MSLLQGPSPRSILAIGRRCRQRSVHSKTVAVRLLETVPGLGEAQDIVRVNTGRMRTALHMQGKAVYVPWKRRADIDAAIKIHDASKQVGFSDLVHLPAPLSPSSAVPRHRPSTAELAALAARISNLPTLIVLPARTIGMSDSLFGSIALSDVQKALDLPDGVKLDWASTAIESGKVLNGERVRELGEYEVDVAREAVGGSKRVMVRVVPLEDE